MGKIGLEFTVDPMSSVLPRTPDMTVLPDGRFIVVWSSGTSSEGQDIFGRIYNADGSPAGNEFVVNSTMTNGQVDPSVTTLSDGRFVVTWEALPTHSSLDGEIHGRIFNSDGSPADPDGPGPETSAEFIVATGAESVAPSVAALSDGRFVVGWESLENATPGNVKWDARAEIFNSDGTHFDPDGAGPANASAFLLSSSTASNQIEPKLVKLPGGEFAAVWVSDDPSDSSSTRTIHVRLFDGNGAPIDPDGAGPSADELVINPYGDQPFTQANTYFPSIAGLSDGRFVVAWLAQENANGYVKSEIFNADGTPFDPDGSGPLTGGPHVIEAQEFVSTEGPSIAVLPDDKFAISWRTYSPSEPGSLDDIKAQIFNSDGTPYDADGSGSASAAPFLVNTNGLLSIEKTPVVAGLADGHFAIAWESDQNVSSPGFGSHIEAQIFQTEGVDLVGTRGSDQGSGAVIGTENAERIDGLEGNDMLVGLGGNDQLYGDPGDDVLNGGLGGDALIGGTGFDTAFYATSATGLKADLADPHSNTGEAAGDSYSSVENIFGSSLSDSLVGNGGDNEIYGSGGDDTIAGLSGSDAIFGGAGNDVLYGQGGHDMLDGGAGDDILSGGAGGSDRFLFQDDWGHDTVLDYETSDRFDFRGTNLTMDQLTIQQDASTVLITGPDGNSITVEHTNVSDISLSNFLFSNGTILASLDMQDDTYTAQRVSYEDAKQSIDLVGSTATGFEIGTDTVTAPNIVGGAGDDTLEGHDRIAGGPGNDVIQATSYELGDAGDDTLIAQSPNVTMIGGAGSDTFFFEPGGSAIIKDFTTTGPNADVLNLHELIGVGDVVPEDVDDALSSHFLRFASSGHDTIVYADSDGGGSDASEVLVAVVRGISDGAQLKDHIFY